MTYETLLYEKRNGIGYITVNRPEKLNALNQKVMAELSACFQMIHGDPEVKAVILSGAGDKSFVAGADISELAIQDPVQGQETSMRGQKVLDYIEDLGKPVVAV